jgi:hypothetical protein
MSAPIAVSAIMPCGYRRYLGEENEMVRLIREACVAACQSDSRRKTIPIYKVGQNPRQKPIINAAQAKIDADSRNSILPN